MLPLKAIIIDDEKFAVEVLEMLLQEYASQIQVIDKAYSQKEGLAAIIKHKPDVVFLDVEMPDGTGFDLLTQIPDENFKVVFTTAHNIHALQAIKFSALDYLLKPVDTDELDETIQKLVTSVQPATQESIHTLQYNTQNISSHDKKILLSTKESMVVVSVDDIIWCEGERNYTSFHTVNQKNLLVSKTLKEYETLLSPFGFARVHQSALVNLKHVQEYIRGTGGEIKMNNGSHIRVSKEKKDSFLSKLSKILIN